MPGQPQIPYKSDLIKHAMSLDALKFGTFTLKSGRVSPYFINAALLNTGPVLATLAKAYATTISEALESKAFPEFDVLFGPAYKGIPFAAVTSLTLYTEHQFAVGFAYDRKEVKDHGEGGKIVGGPISGKRVVVLDDVMTSGKAVREAIKTVREHGGDVVGVVQALDREEVGQDGVSSTVKEIEQMIGSGRVLSILGMRDLMVWLEENGMQADLEKMKEYQDKYGLH